MIVEESSENPLRVERLGHVMLVTLDRPHRRNAPDGPRIESLRTLWGDADTLRDVSCISRAAGVPVGRRVTERTRSAARAGQTRRAR